MRICKGCQREIPVTRNKIAVYCSNKCNVDCWKEANKAPGFNRGSQVTSTTGALSEFVVSIDLARKGFEVFRAIDPAASCDLVVLKGGRFYRIEVRSGVRYLTGRIAYATHKLGSHRQDCVAVVLQDDSILYEPPLSDLQEISQGDRTVEDPDTSKNVCPNERYWELFRRFPLRPIRSDEKLSEAIAIVDSLIDRGDLDAGEQDYLDVLASVIERYESEHHPMSPVYDADILRHLIEARATTQARVAAGTGMSESTVSEVLSGKRKLNRRHIEILSRYFCVSPSAFISEPG